MERGEEDQRPTKSSAYTRFPRLVQTLFCYLTELVSKSQYAGDLNI